MKRVSKVLALVLAFVMLLSMGLINASAAFPDVDDSNQYKGAIDLLSSLKILGGYEDGTFKPENNITRAEFAKIVYAVFNGTNDATGSMFAGESEFKDVKATDWYAGFVNWSYNNSILGGYGDGTVKPTNNVAVKEAIKMAVTCVTEKTLTYPMGYIQEARAQGLLDDVAITDTDAYATRGQVAQIAYNLLFTKARLCMKSTGDVNSSGDETYTKTAPITFVYGLTEVGGEDSKYICMLAATYDCLYLNYTVSSLDEGKVAFLLYNKDENDMQGTLVSTTPYVYEYNEDITDLFGQHLVLYLNGKDELIAVTSKSTAIHTTKNKLKGNGTSTPITADGTTITLNSYRDITDSSGDITRYYVFDHGYVQQPDGYFREGTDINNMRITALVSTSARNYDEPITVIDANNDGSYDTYIQYAAGTAQVTKYSYAGGSITFGFLCDTSTYSNSMGNAANTPISSQYVDGFELFKDCDFSDDTRPVYANLFITPKGDGRMYYTATVAPYVEGTLESINSTGKSAVIDGKSYPSFYRSSTSDENGIFQYISTSLGSTVRVYFDTCGYAQAVSIVDDDEDYNLHICKVKSVKEDVDRLGVNLTASMVVIEMDGTEKTYTLQPRTDYDDIDYDWTTEVAAEWYKQSSDDVFWARDLTKNKYAIAGNYIQLELDDTTGLVKKISTVESLDGNGPTNTTVSDKSKWSVTTGALCYDDENGFYVGDEDTVESFIGWPGDTFTGMYYESVNGTLETEYYTKDSLPEFYNDGDVTVVSFDREALALIINTKPVLSTKDKLLGIVTSWNTVSGETKTSDDKNTYRYAVNVWSDGDTKTYYTEDFTAAKLPTVSMTDDPYLEGLAADQLVYIQLLSNGKIKTKSSQADSSVTVLDIDYIQENELNFAYADFNRSTIYTAYNVTTAIDTVAEGWAVNPVTGLQEYNSAKTGSVVRSASAQTLRTCDETVFYTIDNLQDVENASSSELFQSVATSNIKTGGEIIVTDPDTESFFVFAYTLLTTETADNKDNVGKLGTVFVFNNPINGKLTNA